MSDSPPKKAKRVFKRFKLSELSLVDEPCVPGSDVVVIKVKPSTASAESDTSQHNEEAPDPSEVRKRLEPLAALNDALAANEITPTVYVAKARELVEALEDETRDGEPIQKMAAAEAATIIAETVMDLEQMQAALEAANTAIETVQKRNSELETEVSVEKARADKAVADLAVAQEAVEKAKKAAPAEEPSDEEVLKALPAAVRETVLKARKIITDNEARETTALTERAVAKAKKLGVKDPDALGAALVEVKKVAPQAALAIDAALDQAAVVVAESEVLKSLGYASGMTTVVGGEDPEAALNAAAEVIRKAKPDLTKEEAFTEAMDANPALYSQYVAKRRNLTVAH